MASRQAGGKAGQWVVVWVEVEPLADHARHDVAAVREEFDRVFDTSGGVAEETTGSAVVVGCFAEPAAAVEAAVLGQWAVQRREPHPGVKARVGIHLAAARAMSAEGAAALCAMANGNQIVVSGPVDTATGGTLDARPMGMVALAPTADPVQVWLMTDSRTDVDRRPLRLDVDEPPR